MNDRIEQGPILVTGFEPFGGRLVNSSWEAARGLDGWQPTAEARVAVARLPVEWGSAGGVLRELIERLRPSLVLNVGQGGETLSLERFARNLNGLQKADNAGQLPPGEQVDPAGPEVYQTRFDLETMLARLGEARIEAVISSDAGSFLCNFVSYHSYAALAGGDTPTLFVHVPPVEEPDGADRERVEQIRAALRIVIGECLRQRAG